MSRRPFAWDLDHGYTPPLPPKVEAWLDQKATEQKQPPR